MIDDLILKIDPTLPNPIDMGVLKDKQGLLPSSEYMECACCGVQHNIKCFFKSNKRVCGCPGGCNTCIYLEADLNSTFISYKKNCFGNSSF